MRIIDGLQYADWSEENVRRMRDFRTVVAGTVRFARESFGASGAA